jgi:uncharacterized damage-inducible protein DinB
MTITNTVEIREASRRLSAADHAGTIRSFYPYWDAQYRPYLLLALDALPREHFGFKPRPEMLTAHQIIVHIAENEWGFVHNIVDGGTNGGWERWVVQHEDPSQGWRTVRDAPDHEALRSLLEESHRPTQRWFARPAAELGRVFGWVGIDAGDGGLERKATLHWILDGVQEHEIHHRAQLNMYLRLMGITPPSV